MTERQPTGTDPTSPVTLDDAEAAVPESEWFWDGHAGHLIVGDQCQFHLATRVGEFIVSTVGEWAASLPSRADGTGDYAKFSTIGAGRLFETFVFRADGEGYGEIAELSEIDSRSANDHDTATANHMAMCRKYASPISKGDTT